MSGVDQGKKWARLNIEFSTFGTSIIGKTNNFGTYASGKRKLNETITNLPNGNPSFTILRSAEFNNVWNVDEFHIINSQIFACKEATDGFGYCQLKNNKFILDPIYDIAYSYLTSSGEDYFIDIPPYNPVIQDVIKSCSN